MHFRNYHILFVLFVLLVACTTSKKAYETNLVLDEKMKNRSFQIDVRTIQPQMTQAMAQVMQNGLTPPGSSMARIDVNGSGYFLKVYGDSIHTRLPYYGERQMSGGYQNNTGITINAVAQNFTIEQDGLTKTYDVNFTVADNMETYQVFMHIKPNETTDFSIRSSHRNRIHYTGMLNTEPEEVALSK